MQDDQSNPEADRPSRLPLGSTKRDDIHSAATVAGSPADLPSPAKELSGAAALIRLRWFFTFLACLLVLSVLVPYFTERVQYAITRGRQRAEYEGAAAELKNLPLENLSKAYQLVSQRIAPSVVHINVASMAQSVPADEFASLFGLRRREAHGQGSGVIIDEAGFILTNNHVVSGASKIQVTLGDGRVVDARIVGVDEYTDLALVKIRADKLVAAQWGDSDELEVGALVWAVGSPFGLQRTITFGILSAKNREGISDPPYLDFLQTDAAVNPGNSGGPLVDAGGRVVGINTAIVGQVFQGISFAIPSSVARPVYERLKAQGRVERGWLGVSLWDVTEESARELNLSRSSGALVHQLASVGGAPSPAQEAGIRPGDIITSWNGNEIKDSATLSRLVARTEIDSTAQVILVRRGREMTLNVTVGQRPPQLR